jgi:hypothetical protein
MKQELFAEQINRLARLIGNIRQSDYIFQLSCSA